LKSKNGQGNFSMKGRKGTQKTGGGKPGILPGAVTSRTLRRRSRCVGELSSRYCGGGKRKTSLQGPLVAGGRDDSRGASTEGHLSRGRHARSEVANEVGAEDEGRRDNMKERIKKIFCSQNLPLDRVRSKARGQENNRARR